MDAEKLFKMMGFDVIESTYYIAYYKQIYEHSMVVLFDKEYQTYRTNDFDIDIELHKAIVKQMIELEWIDIEELEELL